MNRTLKIVSATMLFLSPAISAGAEPLTSATVSDAEAASRKQALAAELVERGGQRERWIKGIELFDNFVSQVVVIRSRYPELLLNLPPNVGYWIAVKQFAFVSLRPIPPA
jgi:hypothetical protein